MPDSVEPSEWVQRGIAAAKAGQRSDARQWLIRAVKANPQNEQAWLWLAAVVDDPTQQQTCLQRVLAINPSNARARQGLAALKARSAPAPAHPAPQPAPEPPHPAPAPAPAHPSPQSAPEPPQPASAPAPAPTPEPPAPQPSAGTTSERSLAARLATNRSTPAAPDTAAPDTTPAAPDTAPAPASRTRPDIRHCCPYCGATTSMEERTCNACGTNLMVRAKPPATVSVSLFFLGAYWGISGSVIILANFITLNEEPQGVWWMLAGGVVLLFAFALLLRFRLAYYVTTAAFVPLFIKAWSVHAWPLLLPLFLLIPRSYRDFFPALQRLQPSIAERSPQQHFDAGKRYEAHKMWYMAAQEWQHAVAGLPGEATYHQKLGLAYTRLKQFDRALNELQTAARLKPDDARIQEALRTVERHTRPQQ